MSDARSIDAVKDSVTVDSRGGVMLKVVGGLLMLLGGLLCLMLGSTPAGRDAFASSWLMGFIFVWVIVLGALFLVVLHHIIGAVWSVVIRRVSELVADSIWLVGLFFIPVLIFFFFGSEDKALFSWIHADPHDEIIAVKEPYLNKVGFVVRAILYFVIWILFARFFVSRSLKQDTDQNNHAQTHRFRQWSPPFMILFGFSVTFAGFDWMMSLDAHWFSTIFGVYIFAGLALSSLSVITILVIWLNGQGRLGEQIVRPDHLYSLGCLLFTFTCFWAYIWFSQFMLIWYGNVNEETIWFAHRGWGHVAGHEGADNSWLYFTIALLIMRFVIPFALLLGRWAKTNTTLLTVISLWILLGQVWDLYWLILPQAPGYSESPSITADVFGPLCLMAGAVAFNIGIQVQKHRCVPVGDPLFEDSYRFQLTI